MGTPLAVGDGLGLNPGTIWIVGRSSVNRSSSWRRATRVDGKIDGLGHPVVVAIDGNLVELAERFNQGGYRRLDCVERFRLQAGVDDDGGGKSDRILAEFRNRLNPSIFEDRNVFRRQAGDESAIVVANAEGDYDKIDARRYLEFLGADCQGDRCRRHQQDQCEKGSSIRPDNPTFRPFRAARGLTPSAA